MSKRGDRDLLADIIICLGKIRGYTHGLTYEDVSSHGHPVFARSWLPT